MTSKRVGHWLTKIVPFFIRRAVDSIFSW